VPQVEADIGDDEYAESPATVTILGAAKLAGRIGGFSVGALSAVTQEEHATVASGLSRTETVVEPLTGFNVLRARREFANRPTRRDAHPTNRRLTPTRFRLSRRSPVASTTTGASATATACRASGRQPHLAIPRR
jgi:hypothetical protein